MVTFSFELYPPRDAAADAALRRELVPLVAAGPEFISVTYGANGSCDNEIPHVDAKSLRVPISIPLVAETIAPRDGYTKIDVDNAAIDLGGVKVGPADPVMAFKPDWQGDAPSAHAIEIASLKGCDVAPVDLTDPGQALRLKGYIWPEHGVRFERMDAAIKAAQGG